MEKYLATLITAFVAERQISSPHFGSLFLRFMDSGKVSVKIEYPRGGRENLAVIATDTDDERGTFFSCFITVENCEKVIDILISCLREKGVFNQPMPELTTKKKGE